MRYFLTSSPMNRNTMTLNEDNLFVVNLKKQLSSKVNALFICSNPDSYERTDFFAEELKSCFERSGILFHTFHVLDHRNEAEAEQLVHESNLVVLLGGHVPTQNTFFQQIGLRSIFAQIDSKNTESKIVVGFSAGSMNSADVVYAQPELEGEALDPQYQRFLTGLGLTKKMVIPHYQYLKNERLDGLQIMEEIAYPDSVGKQFYAMVDGAYIYGDGNQEIAFGEIYMIQDGSLTPIAKLGEQVVL